MLSRRSLFIGATTLIAAPSIVRVARLMPVSVLKPYEGLTIEKLIQAKRMLEQNSEPQAWIIDMNSVTRELLDIIGVPEQWRVQEPVIAQTQSHSQLTCESALTFTLFSYSSAAFSIM